jgi:ATP-binding cassette subfamily B protein
MNDAARLTPGWTWPIASLPLALEALGTRLVPQVAPRKVPAWPAELAPTSLQVGQWIEDASQYVGLDAHPHVAEGRTVASWFAEGGPLLVVLPGPVPARFLLALEAGPDGVVLLAPDGQRQVVPAAEVEEAIEGPGPDHGIREFCRQIGIGPARHRAVDRALGGRPGERPLILRFSPAHLGLRGRFAEAKGYQVLAGVLLWFVMGFGLLSLSWWLLGKSALEGHLDLGWFLAWAILLQSFALCRAAGQWEAGKLAIVLGGLLRERLLEGILRIPIERVRAKGIGYLFGKVMDADTLDGLSRTGGQLLLADIFQLGFGIAVLCLGATPGPHLALLLLCLGVAALLVRQGFRRMRDWTQARLRMSDSVMESMVGYRTRLAQLPAAARDESGAQGLDAYAHKSEALDRVMTLLGAVLPRAWLIGGVLALLPGFALTRTASAPMVVSLGGILFVYFALRRIATETGPTLATAIVAYQSTAELFKEAAEPAPLGEVAAPPSDLVAAQAHPPSLLIARDLSFQYPNRLDPVLRGCDFQIGRGDRILVVGASGSGKSTLASLLTGLRRPSHGLLLLDGFDHHSLRPERWRQRSASVPQGYDNHILSASLLFNIAMARRWPPTREDVAEIQAICGELGLGDLLERMPNGLQQMVGDSGWQLSQGEKARVCVARALLQRAELRVLDESLAVLDPVTMDRVLSCLLARPESLLVISHG